MTIDRNFCDERSLKMADRIASLSEKMDEREKQVNIQIKAIERSTSLAKLEMDRRLEGMNEIRAQLDRQAGTFATIEKVEDMRTYVMNKIDTLRDISSVRTGSGKWTDYLIMALISAIIFGAFTLVKK